MKLIIYFIITCFFCFCTKGVSKVDIRNNNINQDSLAIVSQLILDKYDELVQGNTITYPFNSSKPQSWESYFDFFNDTTNRFYIETGYIADVNQDGINDRVLLVNHIYMKDENYKKLEEVTRQATIFRDSIFTKIKNTKYFIKNNAGNYYFLKDKVSSIMPTHFIILLGHKDDTYILHVDNTKLIPVYTGNRKGYDYSINLDDNKININANDYFEPINTDKKSEISLTFTYNVSEKDWILEKVYIHFWLDNNPDIDDNCEITGLNKIKLTAFDYNTLYTLKRNCYK